MPWSGPRSDRNAEIRRRPLRAAGRDSCCLADRGYQGAGDTVAVPHRRRPGKHLTLKQKYVNHAHSRLRWPIERSIASVKTWRIPRKTRCTPSRMTSITKAILTLETLTAEQAQSLPPATAAPRPVSLSLRLPHPRLLQRCWRPLRRARHIRRVAVTRRSRLCWPHNIPTGCPRGGVHALKSRQYSPSSRK
ncbi:transposase family protein [Streptomyces sp. TX20-6-3]|uniref:transposase family protein n=1 Tax=Streptomyces sp. TX20-6-3 TaxID=3028705 RepID=UPI0034E037ED